MSDWLTRFRSLAVADARFRLGSLSSDSTLSSTDGGKTDSDTREEVANCANYPKCPDAVAERTETAVANGEAITLPLKVDTTSFTNPDKGWSLSSDSTLSSSVTLDFETCCNTDGIKLKTVGAWRYAADPATEVICLPYRCGEEWRSWVPGEPIDDLAAIAADPAITFVCFGQFEQAIWHHIMVARFGFPAIPISRWHDAQAVCAYHALPLDLKRALTALDMPIKKDEEGRRLVLSLSRRGAVSAFVPSNVEFPNLDQFVADIVDRDAAWKRRQAGEPWPWSPRFDLSHYFWCQTERERDRETRLRAQSWREPHRDDPNLFFAMALGVIVLWQPTLDEIGYPDPWDPERFLAVMAARDARGEPTYRPRNKFAYRIPVPKGKGDTYEPYHAALLTRLWADREEVRPRPGDTLAAFAERLAAYGLPGFWGGQVIADMKYVEPLASAPDWSTWAVSDPGSRPGMHRLLGRPPRDHWPGGEKNWFGHLQLLMNVTEPRLAEHGIRLHAQDLQNNLCEHNKLCRWRNGEAAPKFYRKPVA